jgi:hypothetical protein
MPSKLAKPRSISLQKSSKKQMKLLQVMEQMMKKRKK